MEKRKFNSNKGITLIALVITIVVMLILAGVTINLTLGQNGIFTTAQKAAQNYTQAQNQEMADISNFESTLSNVLSGGEEHLNGTWSAKNKVNKPKLANTGLTPVTINANGTYGVPNIEEDSWYSYDGTTNRWANAQTKDGSMWVWIPRFAYKLDEENKTIDVVFLQGTSNKDFNGNDVTSTTYVDAKNATGAYIVHPAFRDGSEKGLNNEYANGEWDKEIEGFWMAKFEAGYVGEANNPNSAIDSGVRYSTIKYWNGDLAENYYGERTAGEDGTFIKYPTFQANRPSMNNIGISDAYKLCRSLQNATTVYGLSNIDSHMTKNSEWGAVAYLAYSKYGRNGEEVVLNNISLEGINTVYAVTGYGATATNAGAVSTSMNKIESGQQAGSWLTAQGQTASTTGNIYGIYDLSGGAWEGTSAYITIGTNYETYGGELKGDSTKYKTKYAYKGDGSTAGDNYAVEENQARKGDAVAETSTSGNTNNGAWFSDYSGFQNSVGPFFMRGGRWVDGINAGAFAFNGNLGYCNVQLGFRAVLVAE